MNSLCKPKAALLLAMSFLCSGCNGSSKTIGEKTAASRSVEMKPASIENTMRCPSQDFAEFLRCTWTQTPIRCASISPPNLSST